jgi:hypothetical protein
MKRIMTATALVFIVSGRFGYAQHSNMPTGMTHEEHLAEMKKDGALKARGGRAMGFDQDTATHHFVLTGDGGIIEVEANDPHDLVVRDSIRAHLSTIAREFANGSFDTPFATHAEVPPGVPELRRLTNAIAYRFEPTDRGGRVRMVSAHADAIRALHAFLRYQIAEHRTGDPLDQRGLPRDNQQCSLFPQRIERIRAARPS